MVNHLKANYCPYYFKSFNNSYHFIKKTDIIGFKSDDYLSGSKYEGKMQSKVFIKLFAIFIITFSGALSLGYQVVWERTIRYNFGGDVVSLSIVSGTFIFGLGLGVNVSVSFSLVLIVFRDHIFAMRPAILAAPMAVISFE